MLTPCYTSGYADTSQYMMLGDWCYAVTGTVLLPPHKSNHRYREGHRGENTFNDSEICAEPLTVNILNDKFNIAFKPANNNAIYATQASKGTVTVKTGDREAVDVTSTLIHSQEDGTDTLKAVKMGSEVKITAKPGYKFKTIEAKNNSPEAKIVVLIPATDKSPDAVFVHEGFMGTLEATQIAASDNAKNNYAFNGKQFVWVKNAIDAAEGMKADEEASQEAVDKTTEDLKDAIATAETDVRKAEWTGINDVKTATAEDGVYYDMLGRRTTKPIKGQLYFVKGMKVIF